MAIPEVNANSVDPDQMPHCATSNLHCLQCPFYEMLGINGLIRIKFGVCTIMLLNGCFHTGPDTGPRAVVLARGLLYWPEANPRSDTVIRPMRLAEDL